MIALIDGDIVLHRVGYTTDNESEGIARARTDEMLDGILVDTKATEYQIFLSDSRDKTFRFDLTPEYKANRKLPRPVHYEALKEYLIVEWGARIAIGMEADDALGINQQKFIGEFPRTTICSIDKDLQQIPGLHYNFVKKEWTEVDKWNGLKWFYKQILIGDVSDNIKGCTGIGPVRSGRILDSIGEEEGEEALFEAVCKTYQSQEKQKSQAEILEHILLVGRLLKIKQKEEEQLWDFPSSRLIQESTLPSTQPKQAEPSQSTEPTKAKVDTGTFALGEQTDDAKAVSQEMIPSKSVEQS